MDGGPVAKYTFKHLSRSRFSFPGALSHVLPSIYGGQGRFDDFDTGERNRQKPWNVKVINLPPSLFATRNLTRNDILLAARTISVADAVDAITSMRPYRAALGLDVVIAEIVKFKDVRYDAEVGDAVMQMFQSDNFKMPEA